jgi:hypothetical protein
MTYGALKHSTFERISEPYSSLEISTRPKFKEKTQDLIMKSTGLRFTRKEKIYVFIFM